MKKVIINADDFGYSKIFNEEILKLAKNKKITGISVMVDYFKDNTTSIQYEEIKKYKDILGLHVDFENINLNEISFEDEIIRQYNLFIDTFDIHPHFLDMHKYLHKIKGQESIEKFCNSKNIYYRNLTGKKNKLTTSEEKITGSFLDFNKIKIK